MEGNEDLMFPNRGSLEISLFVIQSAAAGPKIIPVLNVFSQHVFLNMVVLILVDGTKYANTQITQ